MPDTSCLAAAVGLPAVITSAPRAVPFAVIEPLRSSRLAISPAARMPAALMLRVYLPRDDPSEAPNAGVLTVFAVVFVAARHWWRSNALLGIFAGTTLHVLATNLHVQ